jgi:hypothetical protein
MVNKKYIFNPPYKVDKMLVNHPLFKTTHLNHYTYYTKHKYSYIKSKYKNYKIKSTTTG